MPDFTKEVYFHCRSVEDCTIKITGSSGEHTVHRGRTKHYQNDWICSCNGYKFRGICKHVKVAREHPDFCNWQQFIDGGDVVVNDEGSHDCPNCGGPAIAMEYAV